MWWVEEVFYRFEPSKTVGMQGNAFKPKYRTSADGDPAADGICSSTVGRCNKSVFQGANPKTHFLRSKP